MTTQLIAASINRNARRANVYDHAGRIAEGEAFATAAQRMHILANEQAGLFNSEPFAQIRGQVALDTDPDMAARCRHCGYRGDEHDFDGACPSCEDDAHFYRLDNEPPTESEE